MDDLNPYESPRSDTPQQSTPKRGLGWRKILLLTPIVTLVTLAAAAFVVDWLGLSDDAELLVQFLPPALVFGGMMHSAVRAMRRSLVERSPSEV